MKYLNFLLSLFLVSNVFSQDYDLYDKELFIFQNDTLDYRILRPLNFDPNKQYPVHLFLHGSGERGDDNSSQLIHGGELFLKKENFFDYNNLKRFFLFHIKLGLVLFFQTQTPQQHPKDQGPLMKR